MAQTPGPSLVVLTPEDLEALVVRAVRRALTAAADDGMTPQSGSPLGPRRHCDAVKRRLAAGAGGAAKIGRRYLLTPAALQEELSQVSSTKAYRPMVEGDPGARLRRELGLPE